MEIHSKGLQVAEYTKEPFTFSGKSGEFFGIWVVNILLSILSLGIYSAWAKVRTNQYFYGNTQLDGSAFQYLAKPMQILKGRVIAALALGLYYFLNTVYPIWGLGLAFIITALIPAIIVLSMSFRMRNTAYRNITFNFERNFKQAYAVYAAPFVIFIILFAVSIIVAIPQDSANINAASLAIEGMENPPVMMLSVILAMVLAYPFWEYLKTNFIITNTRFGTSPFLFETHAGSFYALYILSFLLFIAVAISFVIIASAFGGVSPDAENLKSGALMIVILPFYLWAFAYLQTKKTNLIFNHVSLKGMPLESQLTVSYMFFLYVSNTLAILLSFGLLIPWTLIRTARYRASTLSLLTDSNLDDFVAKQQSGLSALGEEFGDVFDIDVGL